jgi:hypothetical protein
MSWSRTAILLGAAAIALTATRAEAAAGIGREALDKPQLNRLPRIGVMIVGAEGREGLAARAIAARALVIAGHRVVPLPTAPDTPRRRTLLGPCATHELDAVALVRISTDPRGWRVNVDIHDPEGEPIMLGNSAGSTGDPYGGSSLVPVFASYAFALTTAEIDAEAEAQRAVDQTSPPPQPRDDQPRLWVTENFAMFGPVRIKDDEFFRLVGRPDLYRRHRAGVVTLRVLGYTALGIGLTTLVIAIPAQALSNDVCDASNGLDQLTGRPEGCQKSTSDVWAFPLAISALGGALLVGSYALSADRPSLETRKELARAYNARIGISAAPSPQGDGGVMLINGRF